MKLFGKTWLRQAAYDLAVPNIMPKDRWHSLLEQEVGRALASHQPVSVIFVDIDNLKHVNDSYGHAEGDRIIDELQRALILVQNSFRTRHKKAGDQRPIDIATVDSSRQVKAVIANIEGREIKIDPGRIGGDEFAVLCRTAAGGTDIIVNRLRDIFRQAIGEELKANGVDISIGASTWEPGMTMSDLLKSADKRLYADKESHLPKLSEKDIIVFRELIKTLEKMNIRPRDMSKYAALYAQDYVNKKLP
jgi:GGDEF domain-containing protein